MPIPILATPTSTSNLEVVFLGTGASMAAPYVSCLTASLDTSKSTSTTLCRGCTTCLDPVTSLPLATEAGKNARGNTCGLVRRHWADGSSSVILIDCGKTFLVSAMRYLKRYGIRKIDAVLLTHEHADAILGLDDLTQWSKHIQGHVDVYCDERTLKAIKEKFPYLVSSTNAIGSGTIAQLEWHLIEAGVETNVAGMPILPLPVQHGWLRQPTTQERTPYLILSFLISSRLLWMSDVREIPLSTLSHIRRHAPNLSLLVIDGNDSIAKNVHLPHARLPESLALIHTIGCKHNLLVGMGHHTIHEGLVAIGRELQRGRLEGDEDEYVSVTRGKVDDEVWNGLMQGRGVCVRPAFDGLKVSIHRDGDGKEVVEGIPW